MTRLDPIIAVNNIETSTVWYQKIFGFTKDHGGDLFSVLVSGEGEVILCLHKWGEHHHPTLIKPDVAAGNGLLLYFRTENLSRIYENAIKSDCKIEEEMHVNPNSLKKEFSLRDPDGYYLTVTEFHRYKG